MMPLYPSWPDIAIRLLLTMAAGAVIGFNRGAEGHAAGFRTTILVGLAASVAMIQANILLPIAGKTPGSFAVMDMMRLPLGILTGVGFIGGGTILRRGDLVTGVTTAATLWAMTVIGLCFGGGQLGLGISATLLGVFTLWVLKWIDVRIPREHYATLVLDAPSAAEFPAELERTIAPLGYSAHLRRQRRSADGERVRLSFEVSWRISEVADDSPAFLKLINDRYSVVSFRRTSEVRH